MERKEKFVRRIFVILFYHKRIITTYDLTIPLYANYVTDFMKNDNALCFTSKTTTICHNQITKLTCKISESGTVTSFGFVINGYL